MAMDVTYDNNTYNLEYMIVTMYKYHIYLHQVVENIDKRNFFVTYHFYYESWFDCVKNSKYIYPNEILYG